MSEPSANYQPRHDDPDKLLILTIEDGTNTIILHADEAVAVYEELGRALRLFDLLVKDDGNDDEEIACLSTVYQSVRDYRTHNMMPG